MIYIHVPFCRSFCTYCGFYSEAVPVCRGKEAGERIRFSKYTDAVCAEIEARAEEIKATLPSSRFPDNAVTLYIGGGTPSVLPLDCIQKIVKKLNETIYGDSWHNYNEFTIEVNPEDILEKGDDYVRALKVLGVNRISMGVQSFDDSILKWMNRRHDADGAEEAYWMLRGNDFRNISIDLIYGIGGMSDEVWEATVHKAIGLSPSHISAYQLSVEDNSALADLVDSGRYIEASEEVCCRQYEILCGLLQDAGYKHYEVSNFAYPGFEARHNSAYWRRVPYVGLGPGAHSAVASSGGKVNARLWNSQSESDYVSEKEILTDEDIHVEEIMLALRTSDGIEPEKLPADVVEKLLSEGALTWTIWRRLRIPEEKFFVSDEIIRELI